MTIPNVSADHGQGSFQLADPFLLLDDRLSCDEVEDSGTAAASVLGTAHLDTCRLPLEVLHQVSWDVPADNILPWVNVVDSVDA